MRYKRPKIREARNEDVEQITELVFSVLREYGLEPDPEGIDADLKDIEQTYFARGGALYVLEDQNGSIIGSYGLYPMEPGTCELRKMYLRLEYRGKGLGRWMLEEAIKKAKEMGFREMTLETASALTEAIALYKSFEFVRYDCKHLCWRCDQAYKLDFTQS